MYFPFAEANGGFNEIIAKSRTRCSAAQRFLQFSNMLSVIKMISKFIYKKYKQEFLFFMNQTTQCVYHKSLLTF